MNKFTNIGVIIFSSKFINKSQNLEKRKPDNSSSNKLRLRDSESNDDMLWYV